MNKIVPKIETVKSAATCRSARLAAFGSTSACRGRCGSSPGSAKRSGGASSVVGAKELTGLFSKDEALLTRNGPLTRQRSRYGLRYQQSRQRALHLPGRYCPG